MIKKWMAAGKDDQCSHEVLAERTCRQAEPHIVELRGCAAYFPTKSTGGRHRSAAGGWMGVRV